MAPSGARGALAQPCCNAISARIIGGFLTLAPVQRRKVVSSGAISTESSPAACSIMAASARLQIGSATSVVAHAAIDLRQIVQHAGQIAVRLNLLESCHHGLRQRPGFGVFSGALKLNDPAALRGQIFGSEGRAKANAAGADQAEQRQSIRDVINDLERQRELDLIGSR